jgi:hypothetical protein
VTNDDQHVNVNFEEVATRNDTARHLVAGFSAAMPTPAEIWQQLRDALSDVPALSDEVTRMSAELAAARLGRANLLAAARAALAAHDEGELDPLSYLRDELEAQGLGSQRRPA